MGVDMIETMGFTSTSNITVKIRESSMNKVTVLPIFVEALFLSFAPTDCPIETVAPIARPTIITVNICITWEPMDTAVVLATPSNCPIMNKSAIP